MNTHIPILSYILKEMNNEHHLSKTEQMCYVIAKFPEAQRKKLNCIIILFIMTLSTVMKTLSY